MGDGIERGVREAVMWVGPLKGWVLFPALDGKDEVGLVFRLDFEAINFTDT